jgi:uncharacterized membrane protein YagU involved in acid resistance
MTDVLKGILAGVIATAAVSALLLLDELLGLLPQLDMIQLLLLFLGAPHEHTLGWVLHFVIGSVVGGALFAVLASRLEADNSTKRGILFGLLFWLVMMLVLMPAAGAGLFGFRLSVLTPVVTLVMHVVYGAVLGWTYGKLSALHESFMTHRHHPV